MSDSDSEIDLITLPDAEVSEKLEEYETSNDPLSLKEAADAAALHDGQTPPDPALADSLGRQRVAGWLAILARFKRDLDPEFDPSRPPSRRVAPPPLANGGQLPPGTDPSDIEDPAAREAYVEAIEQNRQRIAAFGANSRLHQAHSAVMHRAPSSMADAHRTLGMQLDEIEPLIELADITPADKQALLTALH